MIYSTGLFIAVSSGKSRSEIRKGVPICGYCRGVIVEDDGESDVLQGDKIVAYRINSVNSGVLLGDELLSLDEALDRCGDENVKLTKKLDGHLLLYDEEIDDIVVLPDNDLASKYFVPDEDIHPNLGVEGIGVYANDLAYNEDEIPNESEYYKASKDRNVLSLVWKLKLSSSSCLEPMYPMLVFNRNLILTNEAPMEIGLRRPSKMKAAVEMGSRRQLKRKLLWKCVS